MKNPDKSSDDPDSQLYRNQSVMDYLLEGCQVIGFDWRYIYINKAAARHNKRPSEELLGKRYMDCWPGVETSDIFKVIKDALENRIVHNLENEFLFPDGSIGWFELSIQPVPEGVFILSVDITSRMLAQKELKLKEERFRTFFESSNVGKSITQMDGRIEVNQSFCNMLGYTQEELKGRSWQSLTPTEEVPKIEERLKKLISGACPSLSFEKRYIHKDGFLIWANVNVVLHCDIHNKPLYYLTTAIDITEQRRSREILEEQEKLLRLFIENSPAAIAMFDTEMRYIMYSKRYLSDFKLPDQSLVGLSLYDVFPDIPKRWKEIHEHCLTGKIMKSDEDPFHRDDGHSYWLRWEIRPWYKSENVIGGIVSFSEDITGNKIANQLLLDKSLQYQSLNEEYLSANDELSKSLDSLQKVNQELAHAKQKAEESDHLKTIFLANMSHEVRTPLNAILGFSGLLADAEMQPYERGRYTKLIQNSGEKLLRIINDIIDISKLESNQLTFVLNEHNVYEMLEKSYQTFGRNRQFQNKPNLHLKLNFPKYLKEIKTLTDEVRFQQVVDNLIMNALKYTDEGTIEIGVELIEGQTSDKIKVYVKDTGRGIPENKKDLVFKRFRQVEENSYHEGTGLGLSISKGIIDRLGGEIGFTSNHGLGSCFYFTSPMGIGTRYKDFCNETECLTHTEAMEEKCIFLAEDDEYSAIYIEEILKSMNAKVFPVTNGKELMVLLDRKSPDLILLDINMPEMTGMECLKEIRAKGMHTKVIVQTAYAMAEEKKAFLNAGCDGYITKPIQKEELLRLISEVIV